MDMNMDMEELSEDLEKGRSWGRSLLILKISIIVASPFKTDGEQLGRMLRA